MHEPAQGPHCGAAERLNQQCFCLTLDRAALDQRLRAQLGGVELEGLLTEAHRHLLSDTPVFVPQADMARMQGVVRAIEATAALPGYRQAVLAWAPEAAGFDPGPVGAFMGYDFHLGAQGPQLIEVNTNAGGAFINAQLARAQYACCADTVRVSHASAGLDAFEGRVVRMFEHEWQRQRGAGRPRRVAIVDDNPPAQYLYPEFRLAQQLMQAQGIEALIADPAQLSYEGGALHADGEPIDLVYNRLVDFGLDAPAHAALREAYLAGAVVVTPHPRVHALLADKRNLTVLSDSTRLRAWGLHEADAQALESALPRTVMVTDDNAEALWQARRELFFKPAAGHAGKGVYRGSKLTRGVFAQILQGGYIAQTYAPPGERLTRVDGAPVALKVDVRLYTYDGEVLLAAARIYQGQTTNFRTPGGGFAPVFTI